jgi:hypothetical protein
MDWSSSSIEEIWDALLSRLPDRIRDTYQNLDTQSQTAVRKHLYRMVREEGWHPEQRISATAALHALGISVNDHCQENTGKDKAE